MKNSGLLLAVVAPLRTLLPQIMFHKPYMYSKTCRDTACLTILKITLLRKVIRTSYITLDRHFQYITPFFPLKPNRSQTPDLMRTQLLKTEDMLISKI